MKKTTAMALDYVQHPILSTTATEFRFKGMSMIAIQMPRVGTVVMGKPPVLRCWSYPAGTSMKVAVGRAFKEMLYKAFERSELSKGMA